MRFEGRRPRPDRVTYATAASEDENALLMSVHVIVRRQTGSMLWRGVGSVLAGCGAGTLVLLVVWLWPGQSVPPSMGPVVVVPALYGPTTAPPSAAPCPGRPPVSPQSVRPGPARTASGGRAVLPMPPPKSEGGESDSRTSGVKGDDEKASRVPRGDVDDERDEADEDEPEDDDGLADEEGEEEVGGYRGDADDEWDD